MPAVILAGFAEFKAALKAIDAEMPKALAAIHKTIAQEAAEGARGIAVGMGGIQDKAAAAIRPASSVNGAQIRVQKSARLPMANAAFWGAKRRSGWYAAKKYEGSPAKQFPAWVGSSWETGTFDGGPYAINRAVFFDRPKIIDHYGQMVTELTRRAFPG